MAKNFALIGAAGFIAPRHMKAIKETGSVLLAAVDKSDSVGVIDSYFPDAAFFTEFERFDRHVELLRNDQGAPLDYVSICSPNYLHDAHVRFALRVGADAICEKPLVLNPWNLDALERLEGSTGRRVFTILQLRLHPSIQELRKRVADAGPRKRFSVELTYVTSRGNWYLYSWKGDPARSGGLATNIGIHFFDMLTWIFGAPRKSVVHLAAPTRTAGLLELERADVRWFLSIDRKDLPQPPADGRPATYRSFALDGEEAEFSTGFDALHTAGYREILDGRGFGIAEARPSVELAYAIRNAAPIGLKGDYHPFGRSGNGRSSALDPLIVASASNHDIAAIPSIAPKRGEARR